jgi:atypical dual specificity phosphatase
LAEQLQFLKKQGIGGILSLTTFALDKKKVDKAEMQYLHLAVEDFTPPSTDQYAKGLAFINAVTEKGAAVVVHCLAGMGRTGCMCAAYFMAAESLSAPEAVAKIRSIRPGSIQTREQEQSLSALEPSRRDIA